MKVWKMPHYYLFVIINGCKKDSVLYNHTMKLLTRRFTVLKSQVFPVIIEEVLEGKHIRSIDYVGWKRVLVIYNYSCNTEVLH